MSKIAQMMDKREREIIQHLEKLYSEVIPLESELGDIRRAKIAMEDKDYDPRAPRLPAVNAQEEFPLVLTAYKNLTMKELTLKALSEQFKEGATALQLIAFFKNVWGRSDVRRSSLSPQLTRLQKENRISRHGRTWHLLGENE